MLSNSPVEGTLEILVGIEAVKSFSDDRCKPPSEYDLGSDRQYW